MAVVKAASSDAEGVQGMMFIGDVGINRLRANCSDFKGLRTIPQMIYQPIGEICENIYNTF